MLVVWFRNGKLYKAHAYSSRTWRRAANSWNEYAQLWNKRFGYDKNVVGVIPESVLWSLMQPHHELPKHLPKEILDSRRKIRELMRVAPWGKWAN
jgi:hypothetical protein